MDTLILRNIVMNTSSNEQGFVLFQYLKKAVNSDTKIILNVDPELTLSSSFLNSSLGAFLDEYGLEKFKKHVKFKGSQSQFLRLSKYLTSYEKIYL